MNTRKILFLLALVFLALIVVESVLAVPELEGEEERTVKVGILAKRGAERCRQKWQPTIDYLTEIVPNYSFELVPLDFDQVHIAVRNKEVDFILANSSFYVELEILCGSERIATLKNLRQGEPYTIFGGVILTRKDHEEIKEVDDLKGKTFMAVDEQSFGGWRMAWREFKAKGIDPYKDFSELKFAGTHDAVVYAVRDGDVDAGTVRTDTLERMADEGKIDINSFHIIHDHKEHTIQQDYEEFPFLHSTQLYPEWPFARVRHTSNELAEKVAITLIKMPADNPAARAAKCAGWTIPHNYQPVRDCLKELKVGPYKDYGKVTIKDIIFQHWPWLIAIVAVMALITIFAFYVTRLNQKLAGAVAEQKREITERKKAEEELKKSEARYRCVFESGADAFLVFDMDGNIVDANRKACDTYGYTYNELMKLSGMAIVEPSHHHLFGKFKTTQAGEWFAAESVDVRKDGTLFPVEVHGTRFYYREVPSCLLAIVRNITERKEAEQSLEKSNRELKEFTYIASHDLREPLRKISSFGQLLTASLGDKLDGDDKENLDFMIDGASRMQQMIEALLAYSRVTTKAVDLMPVDLNKVVEELCSLELAVKIEETASEIDVPEKLANINCDLAQIRQLMQNLIANGLKYQKKDTIPKITIRTVLSDEDMVRVEVADNGIGIKQEHFKDLFVMFKRLHSRDEYEGTGIGLSVCKKIVERHGGNIGVSSTYGEGSTFWFTVPVGQIVEEPMLSVSAQET